MADITLPDETTQEVDYGKSTLFRFSTIYKPEKIINKKETTKEEAHTCLIGIIN